MRVPCAMVGADSRRVQIKRRSFCGVPSNGMLCCCSARELSVSEIAVSASAEDARSADNILKYAHLDERRGGSERHANRGDALSLTGIARGKSTPWS